MYKLGVQLSPPDERDYPISKVTSTPPSFPEKFTVDLSNLKVEDQKEVGICVGMSLSSIKELQEQKEKGIYKQFSPLFVYANRDGLTYKDSGMYPREALSKLLTDGICEQFYLPQIIEVPEAYNIFNQIVTDEIKQNAIQNKISAYVRLHTVNDIKTALMNLGAVLFCIPVYQNFYHTPSDGIVPQPQGNLDGHHAMVCIGWDDTKNSLLILNSWSENWGENGYCWYNYNFPFSEAWSITDHIENQETV